MKLRLRHANRNLLGVETGEGEEGGGGSWLVHEEFDLQEGLSQHKYIGI